MSDLTVRQEEVLRFVQGHIDVEGRPPTLREMGDALGIASTNGVRDHLRALERKGYVDAGRGRGARGLRVLRRVDGPSRAFTGALVRLAHRDVSSAASSCCGEAPMSERCGDCQARVAVLAGLTALAPDPA